MTTKAIEKKSDFETLEQVLINGDLGSLSPDQRVAYYKATCESLGLNPLTKPFDYIRLNGKLTLYAKKDATDQLRRLRGVSIEKPDIQQIDNLIIVTVAAVDRDGRTDSDIGVVGKGDMQGNVGNALMKAVTKAKRRVTLSICGLGILDETEIETILDAQPFREPQPHQIEAAPESDTLTELKVRITALCKELNAANDEQKWTAGVLREYLTNSLGRSDARIENITEDEAKGIIDELAERLAIISE